MALRLKLPGLPRVIMVPAVAEVRRHQDGESPEVGLSQRSALTVALPWNVCGPFRFNEF